MRRAMVAVEALDERDAVRVAPRPAPEARPRCVAVARALHDEPDAASISAGAAAASRSKPFCGSSRPIIPSTGPRRPGRSPTRASRSRPAAALPARSSRE